MCLGYFLVWLIFPLLQWLHFGTCEGDLLGGNQCLEAWFVFLWHGEEDAVIRLGVSAFFVLFLLFFFF